MIRRTEDFSVFSDKEFNKLASAINNAESTKTFDSFDEKPQAEIAAAELRLLGYNTEVVASNGKFKVITHASEKIALSDAEQSGQFKKLAWGRYCFQRESQIGMLNEHYNFDDGSIWKLATDENGNPVLVKEVEDQDDDEVVRTDNRNNNVKVAASKSKEIKYASDVTIKTLANILYDSNFTDEFLHAASPEVKTALYKMFNDKFDKFVTSKLEEKGISDEKEVQELKKLTATALTMEVNSKYTLTKFINSAIQDHLEKVGKQRKYFEKK